MHLSNCQICGKSLSSMLKEVPKHYMCKRCGKLVCEDCKEYIHKINDEYYCNHCKDSIHLKTGSVFTNAYQTIVILSKIDHHIWNIQYLNENDIGCKGQKTEDEILDNYSFKEELDLNSQNKLYLKIEHQKQELKLIEKQVEIRKKRIQLLEDELQELRNKSNAKL